MALSGNALLTRRCRQHSSACRCDQISGEFLLLGLELEKEKEEDGEEVKTGDQRGGALMYQPHGSLETILLCKMTQ